MKKRFYFFVLLQAAGFFLYGQEVVQHRVILIGDAGEVDRQQKNVIAAAADKIISGKTTVVYLGDNVYPRGMGLQGEEEKATEKILQSQYEPLRSKDVPVYFVPGNHDWDRMGKDGLKKIKKQWAFIEDQKDALLKLIPRDGCPDPTAITISDSIVIIAYDSEWWLFPYDKKNEEAGCDCNTKEEVINKFTELLYKNRYKTIILAAHHPFKTYGNHGGYFSLKDHIFPLTAINKNLYIPLPIVGSLYPVLRRTITNPEDVHDPAYKDMIRRISSVFKGFPNVIYAAGHEHGLQFIKDARIQIVSGSGAKESYVKKGKRALYASVIPGFVTVDQLQGNNTRITYYSYNGKQFDEAFTYIHPYTAIKQEEKKAITAMDVDSVTVPVHPAYGNKTKFHTFLFGEGYRKEWVAPTMLPVFKISRMMGGLTPTEKGGGMQSLSLRLVDKEGKEWVLRSVEKSPEALLPPGLRETFARDFVDDVTSLQHPFSALVVPPLAEALAIPHATPVIGVVSPDTALGIYQSAFANKVFLFEEREPLGKSDNTEKMLRNLAEDNDNTVDGEEFLKARMLDVLLGDWDRHEDQWRWYNKNDKEKTKDKYYVSIPRDRDQVFHLTEGLLPTMASRPWLLPTLQGFGGKINSYKYSLFKSNFLNAHPSSQFNSNEWEEIVREFTTAITDSVLEVGLERMPASAYHIRYNQLFSDLKQRRDNIPKAMDDYYKFINRVADIRASDKSELYKIQGTPEGDLQLMLQKINKDGELKDTLVNKLFDAKITKQIRLYTGAGNDSVFVDNNTSSIKIRLIGGNGNKIYHIAASKRKIRLYDGKKNAVFDDPSHRLKKNLSNDSLNTAFVPSNLYNVTMPLITGGYNLDDGLLIGLGIKYTHQGFRKIPYASEQQITVRHSFSTSAFRIRYKGDFINTFGKAALTVDADIRAPENTQNFFGRGNETVFEKIEGYKKYHRTRFSLYTFNVAAKWDNAKGRSISVGPSLQYYHFDADDNDGRFINNTSLIGSYDSTTISKAKAHAGLAVQLINDKRNNTIMPSSGSYINIKLQGYKGLNSYSKAFMQLIPEFSFYKNLDAGSRIIIANRIGGGITIGKTAFYQSLFVGGQENLWGYRQYRFAGQNSLYNNFEMRIKLARIASYILPGQLGLTGFFDVGRVWEKDDPSKKWHNGVGGGIYFAPAQLLLFQFVMGHSTEGWYPNITMGFRF